MYNSILETVGNTPLIRVVDKLYNDLHINLFCKLEFMNPTGSVKDRAASYIIRYLLEKKIINQDTLLIESSSGNFGVSLSAYAKYFNLRFACVIDPLISPINEYLISSFGAEITKVEEADVNGGYLLRRIEVVNQLQENNPNSYWINQYENPLNAEAYNVTLAEELCNSLDKIDYVFIGVSSGGTITGISQKIKERYPKAKIIAVDIEGSVIFGQIPMKRHIPGIGSSKIPKILEHACIDDVVVVSEEETVNTCKMLVSENCLFAGGSSGSVVSAIIKYFKNKKNNKDCNVVTILPDRGERYFNTIYSNQWIKQLYK